MIRTAAVIACALISSTAAVAGPITQDPCPAATAATVWAEPGGALENLLFAEGDLWVSAGNQILRFDSGGNERTDGLTGIGSPGGLVHDRDGLTDPSKPGWIYAGAGNTLANAILRTGAASVDAVRPG